MDWMDWTGWAVVVGLGVALGAMLVWPLREGIVVAEEPPQAPPAVDLSTLSAAELGAIAKLRAAEEELSRVGFADARSVLRGPQYPGGVE